MTPNNFGSQTRLSVEVAEVYYEGNFVRDGRLPIWEEAGQAELKALVAGSRADRLSANGTLKARYASTKGSCALAEHWQKELLQLLDEWMNGLGLHCEA